MSKKQTKILPATSGTQRESPVSSPVGIIMQKATFLKGSHRLYDFNEIWLSLFSRCLFIDSPTAAREMQYRICFLNLLHQFLEPKHPLLESSGISLA